MNEYLSESMDMKFKVLTDADIVNMMAKLGPFKEMTHNDLIQLSKERLNGMKVSDFIREERDRGY